MLTELGVAPAGWHVEDDGGDVPAPLALPGDNSVLPGNPLPPACDFHASKAKISETTRSTASPGSGRGHAFPRGPVGCQPLQRAPYLNGY